MLLVEIILIAVFLAAAAISASYFFTQTKLTMSSSSQVMQCSTIAKQALESVVSLGVRLYGYKIHHTDGRFMYEPLFIKYNTSKSGNIEHVNNGSELSFPPEMYNALYKNLGITPPTGDPQSNIGKPLIGDAYPFEISTAVLIVNSVNALQYLYNSNNGFFTEKGKMYTNNDGEISKMLEMYKNQFNLEDIKFYIRVAPINLQTEEEVASPPSKILTRPRFHNPQNAQLSPALKVLGDPDIGFEIKVTLEYERNNQEYTCDASHRFSHQIKPIMAKPSRDIHAVMTSLTNGAGQDFLADPGLLLTSCDTDGVGYEDITVTVNFNAIEESQQIGTVILCQMNSYCRSYGKDSYSGCQPKLGRWQRCHDIQPTGSDQEWTYAPELKNPQVLGMTFNDMKVDRRYELYVAEFSMAGSKLREKQVSKFYIDAIRPEIKDRMIMNDAVGTPDDSVGGRDYKGPFTQWVRPDGSIINQWLQCNQDTVEFKADLEDQFTHNLDKCEIKGKREDGTNRGTGVSTNPTQPIGLDYCRGELSGIDQGRQTITFIPSDSCGKNLKTKDLVWDTDLPDHFEARDFPNDPEWYKNTSQDAYPIDTKVPAKTTAGEFPKHYSVNCNDSFLGNKTRKDGNSEPLSCELIGGNPDHNDGCNSIELSSRYYHVCGGNGDCRETNWAVYVPLGEDCSNVRCEPGLSCCDRSSGTCNGVNDKQCGKADTRDCTNPKGGTQTSADEGPSGCPLLGLNNCSYTLPCEASNPFNPGEAPTSDCNGIRQGQTCSFTRTYTCQLQGSGTRGTPGAFPGICDVSGYSCTIPDTCTGYVHITDPQTRCIQFDSNGNCVNSVIDQVSCTHCNLWRATSANCPSITFSGTCGNPSGGCNPKDVGGGNLTLEQCDKRDVGGSCCSTPPCLTCDRSVTCCEHLGDTYLNNTNCPNPCVAKHGEACCTVAGGGTCTGQFCADYCVNQGACPVRDVGDGVCRPTCEHLAKTQGYGYGDDDQKGTDDDTFTGTWTHNVNTCAELNTQLLWGSDNWIKIPLIESKEPQEVIDNGGGQCCGRTIVPPVCDSKLKCCEDTGDTCQSNPTHCRCDGVCGTGSKANGCDVGDKDNDEDLDTTTPDVSDQWICKGTNGGGNSNICGTCDSNTACCGTDTCQSNPTHCACPGVCGSGTPLCTSGNPDPSTVTLVTDTWICKGTNDSTDNSDTCCHSSNPSCTPSLVVTPECGRPHSCNAGQLQWVDRNTGEYKCESGGTDTGICPLAGECKADGCSSGTADPINIPLSDPIGEWTCKGIGVGNDSACCPRNGECNTFGCAVGTKKDINTNQWKCEGICNGGDSATCGCNPARECCHGQTDGDNPHCLAEGIDGVCGKNHDSPCLTSSSTSIDGVCGDSYILPCFEGNPNPPNPGLNDPWICKSITEGEDSASCCDTLSQNCIQCTTCPSDAACDIPNNGCARGERKPSSDSAKWICTGILRGKNVGCCDSSRICCPDDRHPDNGGSNNNCPVDASCGIFSSEPCYGGDPDPDPPPDIGTWICKGKDGGRDSRTCGCNSPTDPFSENGNCTTTTTTTTTTIPRPECGGYDHTTLKGECREGTDTPLSSTNINHQWQCKNTDGKTKDCTHKICNCSICNPPSNPTCPPPSPQCNTGGCNMLGCGHYGGSRCCTAGVFDGQPADTSTHWKWTCKISAQDDSGNVDCSCEIPVAKCRDKPWPSPCLSGHSSIPTPTCSVDVDTGKPTLKYEWTCQGHDGSNRSEDNCTYSKSVECCSDTDCSEQFGAGCSCNTNLFRCGNVSCNSASKQYDSKSTCNSHTGKSCFKVLGCWIPL